MTSWTHGTTGLIVSYCLSAAGVLLGLFTARAPVQRLIAFPLVAVPALILAVLLWSLPASLLKTHVPASVIEILGLTFSFLIATVLGRSWVSIRPSSSRKRGTILEDEAPRPAAERRVVGGLTLAGLRVDPADETKHFKLIGTTGTGKSTAIRELLTGALARGDRAVIADPDGSYMGAFYDPARGDVILNPFDVRAARWDLFAEIQSLVDADHLARSLIADTEGAEQNWRTYARVFFSALLRQLHRVRQDDVAQLYQLVAMTPVEELRDLLNDTPAGPYLTQDNGKFFAGVRAVANTHLACLEHIARHSGRAPLSVRQWVRGGQGSGGGVLFLPYRPTEVATLGGLIAAWMRLAIFEAMSQSAGDQRLWFVIDELDALGPIDGLKDALARLRKFGGRCILGFQSIAQVSGLFGHAEAQTIVENCGTTVIFRCSASERGGTAEFASRLIGEREIIREQVSKSRRPQEWLATKTTSHQHVTESTVLASEIEQLPDLHGFLKFASRPEWRRIVLNGGMAPI